MSIEPTKPRVERQVAKKLWIRELLEGELTVTEGLQPNVLKTARGDAGRVNILGVVVNASTLPTATLSVDDGTGVVVVRSFDRPLNHDIGTFVQIVGRPRTYQGEPYVAAEAVATVASGWAAYRKAELGLPKAAAARPVPVQPAPVPERASSSERIIKLIIELDRGDGAAVEDVVVKSNLADAERIIEQLLLAGDIFELRAGKVKVL
jgi:hypothetical protein